MLAKGYVLREDAAKGFYFSRGLAGGMKAETPIAALEKKLDMKPEGKLSVFITYQWAQKDIAIAIHKAFEAKGFLVIRDEDTLHNGVYIQEFMKVIKHPKLDYVLPIISASYLKSKNCMYEVNQIMQRHHWESSLLPYVVNCDKSADAQIYGGVASYEDYWQEQLTQPEGLRNKKLFENIFNNIRPFSTAITTRIQIPEAELIASGYKALFDTVSEREAAREGARFKEIEELLQRASIREKTKKHDKSREAFEEAIIKLDELEHVRGIEGISAKVYGLYGEYLLRQNATEAGKEQLEIAANFGYVPSPDTQTLKAEEARLKKADEARKAEAEAKLKVEAKLKTEVEAKQKAEAVPSNVLLFKGPKPNGQELSQFLRLVAEGEQDQAEAMLQKNRDLVLFPGNVTDLSGRTFENITGLQLAVWALDWHMWTMLRKYLPDEAAAQQLSITGSWVAQYGLHAGVSGGPLDNLAKALKTYIDKCGNLFFNSEKHWQKQVGGAQLWLPAHVIHEYCHEDRSFDPCPTFIEPTLPRTRKIDEGEWFTAVYNGGKLGEKFGIYRGCDSQGAVWGRGAHTVGHDASCSHLGLGTLQDHAAVV